MPQTRQHIQRSTAPPLRQGRDTDPGIRLTPEGIEQFLEVCRAEGRVEGTLQWYQRGMKRLYDELPEDKTIRYGTLESWRDELVRKGYAPGTINSFLSTSNAYLDFVGHREYQLAGQLRPNREARPELTRTEYLRLLQTARVLGKEKVYLLVKLFGSTGLTVQELHRITVEAVQAGRVMVAPNGVRTIVRIPGYLREELLRYAERGGRTAGPVFVTKEGTPVSRTYVTTIIRQLCHAAQVPEEKGNPRCLRRLYQSTLSAIEANVAALVEQAMDRQLEQDQLAIGWEE